LAGHVLNGQVCLHSLFFSFFSAFFSILIFLDEPEELKAAKETAATPPAITSATMTFFITFDLFTEVTTDPAVLKQIVTSGFLR
jgi:hypothetical protein